MAMKKIFIVLFNVLILFTFIPSVPCSIVGCISKDLSRPFILDALKRLEYRGYDSAGLAFISCKNQNIICKKAVGDLEKIKQYFENDESVNGYVGIGHMRWATHGAVTEANAHPQIDCTGEIAVIHNGIIENHSALRMQLENQGHKFVGQTDTEVIPHLIEQLSKEYSDIKDIAHQLTQKLDGTFALLIIMKKYPNCLISIRKKTPLCIGVGDDGMYVASDPLAFTDRTQKVFFVPDNSFSLLYLDKINAYDFKANELQIIISQVDSQWKIGDKGGYEHFMLKEIYEQKAVIPATYNFLKAGVGTIWPHLGTTVDNIKKLKSITLVGCGTSWHAARIAQFFFETICALPTHVYLASEFRYMPFFADKDTMYIMVSQSGETADTIEAMRMIKSYNLPVVALTNVFSSTLARESNGILLTKAGPEVAVASTKAFTTQLTALYWLSNRIAYERGMINDAQMNQVYLDLKDAAAAIEAAIDYSKTVIIEKLAPIYARFKHVIFLGRHICYPLALEAALKLKEISYIFSQCYPAGELKHGPLALINEKMPVIIFSNIDPLMYKKLLANVQEVKARGGQIIAFVFEGQSELQQLADTVFIIPRVNPLLAPIAMIGVMQFLAYQIAKERGCPIDKPRNLAKSVTVE